MDRTDPTGQPEAEVHIDDAFRDLVSLELVRDVARVAIRRELRRGPPQVTVSISDDEHLRALNRDFRGVDQVTDVLSFATAPADNGEVREDQGEFVMPPSIRPALGDIVMSYPQARRQAEAAGRPVEHEIALLTAHGVLHLLGYDHANPEDERVMFSKTDDILAEVLGPEAVPMIPVLDEITGQ